MEDPRRHTPARGIQRSLVCKSLALDLPPDAMYSKPSIFWPWMCDSHLALSASGRRAVTLDLSLDAIPVPPRNPEQCIWACNIKGAHCCQAG